MDLFLSAFWSLLSWESVIACRLLIIVLLRSLSPLEIEELLPLLFPYSPFFFWRLRLFFRLSFPGLFPGLLRESSELLELSESESELELGGEELRFLLLLLGDESLPSLSDDLALDDLEFDLVRDLLLDLDLDLSLDLLVLGDFLSSSLEELDPESLDEGLGLFLSFPFSTILFLPLSSPSSLEFSVVDLSGESGGGSLGLVLSSVLGETSRLDWEVPRLAMDGGFGPSGSLASSFFSSFFQTFWTRRSKFSLSGAS